MGSCCAEFDGAFVRCLRFVLFCFALCFGVFWGVCLAMCCVDPEGPKLTCPALVANTSVGVNFTSVNFSASISVSDNADPNVDVVCSRCSPDNFTLGVSYVNCTATDHVNLTASCNFSITVNGE